MILHVGIPHRPVCGVCVCICVCVSVGVGGWVNDCSANN